MQATIRNLVISGLQLLGVRERRGCESGGGVRERRESEGEGGTERAEERVRERGGGPEEGNGGGAGEEGREKDPLSQGILYR